MSVFKHLGPNGLAFNQLAEFTQPIEFENTEGRFIQIRVTNKRGRCVVRGVRIWAQEGERNDDIKEGIQEL